MLLWTRVRLFLLMIFVVWGCGAEKKKEEVVPTPHVTIGWQTAWATQAQLALALQRTNALHLAGLQGDFKSFLYGAPMSEAALAGHLDVGFMGDQPAVALLARSTDWKIVARLMYFRGAILVPPNSPIRSVADLRGKKMGIPFGASTHRESLRMLNSAGLEPGRDVELVNIDIQEQGEIIRNARDGNWGSVAAFASWDPHIAQFEAAGVGRVLEDATALGVVVMHRRLTDENPEVAARFLAAFKLSYIYYAQHPDSVDSWFSRLSETSLPMPLLRAVAEIEPNLGTTDPAKIDIHINEQQLSQLQAAADFAMIERLIQQPVSIRARFEPGLASRADTILAGIDLKTLSVSP